MHEVSITPSKDEISSWSYYFKATLYLAIPIILAHLIEGAIPFINTIYAGHLGAESLAAAGLVNAVFFAFMGFGWGIITSVGILTAHRLGGKSGPTINMMFAGLILSVIVGLPIMAIFYWMESILLYFGQEPNVSHVSQLFFYGLALGVVADIAKFALIQFTIAHGLVRIPLVANIASVVLLIFFNDALVYGRYGLPSLGVLGIGLGTALSYWLTFITLLIYVLFRFKHELPNIGPIKQIVQSVREQCYLGIPVGAMFSIELTFFAVLALSMGAIGSDTLAAHQIAMQWFWLIIVMAFGFTEAVTILVSKSFGAKKMLPVKKFIITGVFLSVLTMSVVSIGYVLCPRLFIGIDLDMLDPRNARIIQLATYFLAMCAIFQLIDGARIIVSGALRGLQDTQYPMWVVAVSFWLVSFPLTYLFGFLFDWEGIGLWFAVIVGGGLVNLYLQTRRLIGHLE